LGFCLEEIVGVATYQSPTKEMPIYLRAHTHTHTPLLYITFIVIDLNLHSYLVSVAYAMETVIRQESYKVSFICHKHHC
jgi:hypothetical protein